MLIPRANVTRTTFLQQFFFRFSQWIINSIWMKAKEENFNVAEERKLRRKIREECLFATDMLLLVPSSGTRNFSISSREKSERKISFRENFFATSIERSELFFNIFLNSIRSHNPDCTCFPPHCDGCTEQKAQADLWMESLSNHEAQEMQFDSAMLG